MHPALPDLLALADRLRASVRPADDAASRLAGAGVGDVTYGLDVPAEQQVTEWARDLARARPLSVLTEEHGWRHFGPGPDGTARELPGFDHGGPRIAVDPVDGTRHLMFDMRSAWSVLSYAGPGDGEPRMGDVELGVVGELPDSRAGAYRTLYAARGAGARVTLHRTDGARLDERALEADAEERWNHAFFPFFRFGPGLRREILEVEQRFFAGLAERGVDVEHCFDDQYISNAGQLVHLALGTYRFCTDLRATLAARGGVAATTSHPYDLAGAVLVAREAGCVVEAPGGEELDFPLDARTPVSFAGYANAATHAYLSPLLRAALAAD